MSSPTLQSGIYQCTGCKNKAVHTQGETFQPCRCGTNNWVLVMPTNK